MSTNVATVIHSSKVTGLNDSLKKLKRTMILVGIAKGDAKDARSDGGPDNHLLGFIHEYGAPGANIPARPFLRPGIRSAKEQISTGLEAAIKAALKDDAEAMNAALERTGMKATSAVKLFMKEPEPPFAPLASSTLRNRHRSRLTKGKRENEIKGENVKPLLNTGTLRNAIDYYIEDK